MKFAIQREFRPSRNTLDEVIKYLTVDLKCSLLDLSLGLTKLSFQDNFAGFIETITIPASSSVEIINRLDEVPSYRVILRGGTGAQNVVDGDSTWTAQTVSLKNVGLTTVTVTVAFLK
jgi:hypothetical protein